jgi:hypothetical protein
MNGTLLDQSEFPDGFGGVDELDAFMTRPSRELVDDLATVSGDILVLGAGGKMGPTLTKLARNAAPTKRIVAVARFSEKGLREQLESYGVEAVVCDLLDRNDLARLPRLLNGGPFYVPAGTNLRGSHFGRAQVAGGATVRPRTLCRAISRATKPDAFASSTKSRKNAAAAKFFERCRLPAEPM